MGSEYSQTGRTARRRLQARKRDRPTILDQADAKEASQAAHSEYDKWLYETHLHQAQHNTQSNNRK